MDELVRQLREKAGAFDYDGRPDIACDYEQAANAIELQLKLIDGLEADNDSLCKTIDLYRKLLGGHPDPRGEDGEPGVKCIDCHRDCQMIGLDMPACTAYEPPKKELE